MPARTAPRRPHLTTPAPSEWATAGMDLSNSRAVLGGELDRARRRATRCGGRVRLARVLSTVPSWSTGPIYVAGELRPGRGPRGRQRQHRWLSEPTGFNIGPFGVAVDDEQVYALDGSIGVPPWSAPPGRGVGDRRDGHRHHRHRHPARARRRARARELGAGEHQGIYAPVTAASYRARRGDGRGAVDLRHRQG